MKRQHPTRATTGSSTDDLLSMNDLVDRRKNEQTSRGDSVEAEPIRTHPRRWSKSWRCFVSLQGCPTGGWRKLHLEQTLPSAPLSRLGQPQPRDSFPPHPFDYAPLDPYRTRNAEPLIGSSKLRHVSNYKQEQTRVKPSMKGLQRPLARSMSLGFLCSSAGSHRFPEAAETGSAC